MEELFTKNQQMKEQQRLLTENIKTLENRYVSVWYTVQEQSQDIMT